MADLVIIGDGVDRGTYLLRLEVTAVLQRSFGRFQQGAPVTVVPGDYVYVGSALRSLSGRLRRHAERSDGNPPQAIRQALWTAFPPRQRPSAKKLHWHIDYLLDETAVHLRQIFLIQHPARLETALAAWLNDDPHTIPLAAGLGASDGQNGRSHLLRVTAAGDWWQQLPNQIQTLIESQAA